MKKQMPHKLPTFSEQAGPTIWRSQAEKTDPKRRQQLAAEKSTAQMGSTIPERSLLGRRKFVAVSGATAAAVGMAGCIRRPAENILPYSQAPEYSLPGASLHFATAVSHRGQAVGLLVESHEGRPTKIEGNPEHPSSLGASDAQIQGMILDLYDPDRSAHVMHDAAASSWSAFDTWWRGQAMTLARSEGAGLRLLMEPTTSPSMLRARDALLARFPRAHVHTWTPVNSDHAGSGAQLAFGRRYNAQVDYSRARTIVSIDCDFLGEEPGSIRAAGRFAQGRRLSSPGEMNRLYMVESNHSLTGTNADHRLRLKPSEVGTYLRALAAKLATDESVNLPAPIVQAVASANVEAVPAQWLDAVSADLIANAGHSVVVVGWRQPAEVHALAHALNAALRNAGTVVSYFPTLDSETTGPNASIRELTEAASETEVLVILGGNPIYDAPADLNFAALVQGVATSIHLSDGLNETSAECSWHLPRTSFLESWGDHVAVDGTLSIQQPLIAPLRGGRSEAELMAQLGGIRSWRGYHLVRGTLSARFNSGNLERIWRRSLHRGVVAAPPARPGRPSIRAAEVASALSAPAAASDWEVQFMRSYQVGDGSQANNPWLHEMPDPVTKMVWDNAAYISPASAEALSVRAGDMLNVSVDGLGDVQIPALVLPGHADNTLTLPLGFGRTHAGRHGSPASASGGFGVGVNVYPLRSTAGLGFAAATVSKGSGHQDLVVTHEHHSMADRPIAIDATVQEYRDTPDFAQHLEPTPALGPLWSQIDYGAPQQPAQGGESFAMMPLGRPSRPGAPPRYKWGLAIDLTTCTGCSSCMVACQAENNICVVGKQQVSIGREMHWMRLDRYFVGDDLNDPQVAHQPVQCQHCEEAPCENVCPVAATTHTPEGLNDMAYNRCIGTRYCMNNCPYKVRRFNFLDYHGHVPELRQMQFNPNVTVRMRGVMEKCSYCVQRIQAARIRARGLTTVDGEGTIHERRIEHEEVTPACAQACPSGSLVFGDLNNPESPAHAAAHMDRHYKLLASVGVQPRTTFLGKIRNPNPDMSRHSETT